ncbi:3-oxo-tetronate kinase [Arenibaculum pallidiluteum]|uniref:3-oxo-tetronate kinase n=1 Tax=Arenibaculum pallidiluteum TaxID=2812559 RepID=UPI001A9755A4|nr:3-oxo-tetronate kinase [Arenibaculum pallidiluteum]
MLLGCIADDFTGASDIANTLAKGGMRTLLFNGVPTGPGAAACDAGVVALKTRSIDSAEAVRQSLAALAWLRAQGCRQIVFKVCSTFDSTPAGNIGPVAEALATALDARGVAVCPAFPGAGRRVFMGHLFVGDRLLSESGMERHPLTPMTDPDIRRWLRRQTRGDVGLVALDTVAAGAAAIAGALAGQGGEGRDLCVVDAVSDADLIAIGNACAAAPLLVGGSGVALGLPGNLIREGAIEPAAPDAVAVPGPAVVLAGSCSTATRGQVAAFSADHPVLRVDAAEVVEGRMTVERALAALEKMRDAVPLVSSSEEPDAVSARQRRHGREAVSAALEDFFGGLARGLVQAGWTRLVVAGGETSGAVVAALRPAALRIGPEIDPGVPALETIGAPRLALTLKSGNFGAADFFARAVRQLGETGDGS